MTSENKRSYHHNHHDSNNTSSSSGRATDRMVSLVTLNSSDESSRSNSSLASSSHSNIDLVIDPSVGVSGSLATTSTPSPKMTATPKSSSNKNEEEAYYDEEDEEETTESWSIKTPAVSGGGHFRRRNSSTSIYGTPRRQTSFFGEGSASSAAAAAAAATTTSTSHLAQSALLSSVYDELMASNSLGVLVDSPEQEQRNDESEYNCTECGSYCDRYTAARNSKFSSDINGNSGVICETCLHKHWQGEINELLKFKASLETSVRELRRYLSAKKNQCNENVKSSQQIKKFINMTMQQIKRKVELDLENKRDELFNSIDTFVESQKKLSTSINEDNFQTSERIINEIENILLNTDTDLNFFKLKSVKTFAKSQINKLNQQKSSRIPLYSIFFVPDSTVQVNNTFGKIVLKSHLTDSTIDGVESTLSEFQQQLEKKSSDLTSSNFDNDLLLKPAESLSLGYFDGLSSLSSSSNHLTSRVTPKSLLAESNSSLVRPKLHTTTSAASKYPSSRDLYSSKWTSYDNVYDGLSNLNGVTGSSGNLSYSQNPIDSGFATVRKYQPQYRNNDASMRRAKAYMLSSPTKGPNIQRLTKALSVHSPSESDEMSENYEDIFARKEDNPSSPLQTSTTVEEEKARRPKSSSVYESKLKSTETAATKSSNIEKPKTSVTATASSSRQASSSLLKDLDVPKSKPFVPAKVLMSQNSGSNGTNGTNSSSTNAISGRKSTSGSSVVQKLIQTHNQAVAAAAAAASTTRPFSPPPSSNSNAGPKQPTAVNNSQSSTPK